MLTFIVNNVDSRPDLEYVFSSDYEFECESGEKLDYSQTCDSIDDCPGGEDEYYCEEGGECCELP